MLRGDVMVKVRVKLVREGKDVKLEFKGKARVKDLIRRLGYTVEDVVVLKNGEPLVEDEVLEENSEYVVMPVASGG